MYPVNRYIAKLTLSLNHAISVSLKRNPHSPNSQYIRAILLVKGVHFYGFHSSYSPFLKILIADPAFVNRTVAIMQSGTVMQTRFRVFEGHLSFPLQFMSDFGLYGCGWIDLGEVLQRGSEDQHDGKDEQMNDDIHPTFDLSPHFRQSRMPFEMDVVAHQILNRHFITARNIHHKLEIPAPLLPPIRLSSVSVSYGRMSATAAARMVSTLPLKYLLIRVNNREERVGAGSQRPGGGRRYGNESRGKGKRPLGRELR